MTIKDPSFGGYSIEVGWDGNCKVLNSEGRNPRGFKSLNDALGGIIKMRLADQKVTLPLSFYKALEDSYIEEIQNAMKTFMPSEQDVEDISLADKLAEEQTSKVADDERKTEMRVVKDEEGEKVDEHITVASSKD